jgi:hypothetical protein
VEKDDKKVKNESKDEKKVESDEKKIAAKKQAWE